MKFYSIENSTHGVAQKRNYEVYYNTVIPAAECAVCGKWISVSSAPLFVREGVREYLDKSHVAKSGMSSEQIKNLRINFEKTSSATPYMFYLNDVKPGMAIKFTIIKKKKNNGPCLSLLTPQVMLVPNEISIHYDDSKFDLPIRCMFEVESGVSLIFAPRCHYDEDLYNICQLCFRGSEVESRCLNMSMRLTKAEAEFVEKTGISFLEREAKLIASENFIQEIKKIDVTCDGIVLKEIEVDG